VIIGLLILGGLVVLAAAILGWRLWRGGEAMEPGGSFGTQLFSRKKSQDPNDY
jgi:hypothetical protein